MKDLVSCIVTYKPNIEHLKLLVDKLNKLDIYTIIFDNTPVNGLDNQIVNAERIISLGKNMGIGYAYNTCVKIALELPSKYIIFFDQDTDLLETFNPFIVLEQLEKLPLKDKVGIISLNIQNSTIVSEIPNSNFYLAKYAIGNGMIVKTEIAKEIKFREDLFLDAIDIEYCTRVRRNGYLILAYKDIMLKHRSGEGDAEFSRILSRVIIATLAKVLHKPNLRHFHYSYYSNYSRYYLMIRNNIYLLVRGQYDLDYVKYILFMILTIYDRLGFFKTSKILLKALYHAIIGDLEKDNENIIKNFKAN
ncbi:MAG: glycosyl transferase family 2 [Candidatus Rehaiarchaeum fermentans]|nr:glycosyl transferase family 2 [Candidatus Rehaiarchaeum fermentans]